LSTCGEWGANQVLVPATRTQHCTDDLYNTSMLLSSCGGPHALCVTFMMLSALHPSGPQTGSKAHLFGPLLKGMLESVSHGMICLLAVHPNLLVLAVISKQEALSMQLK